MGMSSITDRVARLIVYTCRMYAQAALDTALDVGPESAVALVCARWRLKQALCLN